MKTAAAGGEFDVVVVGGGPAGAACAMRLARARARVALVERSAFEEFRIGETIGPDVLVALEELGVAGSPRSWGEPCDGVAAAWGAGGLERRPALLATPGRAWRVDRRAFDRALFEQAGSLGVATFGGSRILGVERRAGRWTFAIAAGSAITPVRTPFVVEATGRNGRSPFAPRAGRLWLDRLVGLALLGRRRGERPADPGDAAVVEAAPDGWWYAADLPSGQTLAVFFTDADLVPRSPGARRRLLADQLRGAAATRERAGFLLEGTASVPWRTFDARSSLRRVAVADGWAAAGDALMAFDPLWGRGVGQAIRSGIEVADGLGRAGGPAGGAVPEWPAQAAARFNRYQVERAWAYARERRWATPFWERRSGPSGGSDYSRRTR